MAFVTIIVTLFYIYLLRCITKPILYGSLLMIFVFLLLCTYYTYDNTLKFTDKESNDYKFAMFLFIVCAILTVAYMILVCCMWRAIALGAAVMETASDFIGDNKKVVFLPFIAYFFCLPIVAWWTATSVFIYGLGTPEGKVDSFVCNIALLNKVSTCSGTAYLACSGLLLSSLLFNYSQLLALSAFGTLEKKKEALIKAMFGFH